MSLRAAVKIVRQANPDFWVSVALEIKPGTGDPYLVNPMVDLDVRSIPSGHAPEDYEPILEDCRIGTARIYSAILRSGTKIRFGTEIRSVAGVVTETSDGLFDPESFFFYKASALALMSALRENETLFPECIHLDPSTIHACDLTGWCVVQPGGDSPN